MVYEPFSNTSECRVREEQGFRLACRLVRQDQVDEVAYVTLEEEFYD